MYIEVRLHICGDSRCENVWRFVFGCLYKASGVVAGVRGQGLVLYIGLI
jgi:hypothetical protein